MKNPPFMQAIQDGCLAFRAVFARTKPWGIGTVWPLIFSLAASLTYADPLDDRMKVAEEIVAGLHLKTHAPALIESFISNRQRQMTSQGVPAADIEKSCSELRAFFEDDFDWDAVEREFVNLYASDFSLDELKEIRSYLISPAIQKFMATQPERLAKLGDFIGRHVKSKLGI